MDALTFLYWALAVGFLALVLFSCIALIHLIRILCDFADASASVRDTVEKINDNITRITQRVSEAAEQITEYVIKPFSVIQYIGERVKPIVELLQEKGEEWIKHTADQHEQAKQGKPKKKRRFGRKK